MDGGEVGHACGQLDHRLSIVFSGAATTRRLCTPVIDLSHVGSLHFWLSFGICVFLSLVKVAPQPQHFIRRFVPLSADFCYRHTF